MIEDVVVEREEVNGGEDERISSCISLSLPKEFEEERFIASSSFSLFVSVYQGVSLVIGIRMIQPISEFLPGERWRNVFRVQFEERERENLFVCIEDDDDGQGSER